MIPKIIHLCWVGGGKFPVEIKECIESWQKFLPDYEIRVWNRDAALAIGCDYINEALEARKWAFVADAVRFYAVWKEGGVYMDSDILLNNRFDDYIPESGFATVHEHIGAKIQLQAAFFIGEKGNRFCKECFEYYKNHHFLLPDGSYDQTISPVVMSRIAARFGWKTEDVEQRLDEITVWPGYLLTPNNHQKRQHADAFGRHRIMGSWRKRKFGRKFEIAVKHYLANVRYGLTHAFKSKSGDLW